MSAKFDTAFVVRDLTTKKFITPFDTHQVSDPRNAQFFTTKASAEGRMAWWLLSACNNNPQALYPFDYEIVEFMVSFIEIKTHPGQRLH